MRKIILGKIKCRRGCFYCQLFHCLEAAQICKQDQQSCSILAVGEYFPVSRGSPAHSSQDSWSRMDAVAQLGGVGWREGTEAGRGQMFVSGAST